MALEVFVSLVTLLSLPHSLVAAILRLAMNTSENSAPTKPSPISSEAIIGIGITVAELGVLCLLLGWAEYMRSVPAIAWIWLAVGIVMVLVGGFAAVFARSKKLSRQQ